MTRPSSHPVKQAPAKAKPRDPVASGSRDAAQNRSAGHNYFILEKYEAGVALRGGHHCTQPLMHKLGVESTARASFYFYNTRAEVDRLVEVMKEIQKFFGQ